MSEVTERVNTENEGEDLQPQDLVEGLKNFFSTLVPPTSVVITDIFGTEYNLICSISARKQVKILREFDKLEMDSDINISIDETNPLNNLVQTVVSIATDDKALLVICRCFEYGHSEALAMAKVNAKEKGYVYEEGEYSPADLFSLEELATAIIPLFIRLAKRTSQAVQKLVK